MAKDMFWTDIEQAAERLTGTCIMFGEEPVYILGINTDKDGDAIARIQICETKKETQAKLSDPAWKKFRTLPRLGWVNIMAEQKPLALFFDRRVVRQRSHGLSHNNVGVLRLIKGGDMDTYQGGRFDTLQFDQGFVRSSKGQYPSLQMVLDRLQDEQVVAFSPMYAVFRDSLGYRWLFRNKDRIGLITGADTLCLTDKTSFYKEELKEDPAITITNIGEF